MKCRFFGCLLAAFLVSLGVLLPAAKSKADVTVYTSFADFSAALTTNGFTPTNLDFDSELVGSVFGSGATIGHIQFDGFVAPNLIVTDQFATTSGANYLGIDDPGLSDQFVGGFEFDLSFADSNAIGMFVITGEFPGLSIFDNDILVDVPGAGTASLDVDDLQATIGGTDNVFFIGLIDDMSTFSMAEVRYNAAAVATIAFNIDDITTANDVLLGDVNRDGFVNLLDVAPFVDLISAGGFQIEADINQDGLVNLLDVSPFVVLLSG